MTKKDKILFIDDAKLDNELFRVALLEQSCQKFKEDGIVCFDYGIRNYFQIDEAGTQCEVLFPDKEYEFIFIHHSYNEPTLLPSNGISLIKKEFDGFIFPFSGGTQNSDEIFDRQIVYERFYTFLDYYHKYDKWMPYCFRNEEYKRAFARGILEDLMKQISLEIGSFIKSKEHQKIEKFLSIELKIYEPIPNKSKTEIIEFLRNKIEN